jgi:hypothetical protein
MRMTLLVTLALAAVFLAYSLRSRRAARAAEKVAMARARAAARRNRIPEVSNNLKGVTATQTNAPYRADASNHIPEDDEQERAA